MAEENISQVDEKCCLDDEKPMEISEETYVETMPVMDEEIEGDDVLLPPPAAVSNEINHVNVRRCSTGALDKRGGPNKAQVQTRYRGNQMSSTHDLCKHGKRREDDLVIKPWKLVKKKNVEGGDLGKVETFGMIRKSLGNVSIPEKSLQVAKREPGSEVVKSCDGLRVKRSETKSTTTTLSDPAVVRKVKKTNLDVKKVPRISENKSSKEDLFKHPKSKGKIKTDEPVRCEDVLEKKVSRISENKSTKEDLSKNHKNKEKTKIDEPVCDDVLEKKVLEISENKSTKEDHSKNLKNKEKTKIDEPVRCDDVLEKKVSGISENKSSKEDLLKNLKNKEKTKIDEPVRCEDVLEKTLYVVEPSTEEEEEKKKKKKSIKSVKSEIQQSSEKKILRGTSGKKSLKLSPSLSPSSKEVNGSRVTRSDPRPIRQTTSRSKIGLSEKKETSSATTLVTNPKTESKIRPKRIGLKVTPSSYPTRQLNFKKGKVVEPKPEDWTTRSIKFKKRVVQEPKLRSDVNKKKKNLKDKREGVGKTSISCGEGKREKVVLRHRKVETKKKLQTLFNNVIEETVNKLEEVRKSSKVKALVGAFETVISLQDDNTKTPQKKKKKKIQSETTSSQVVQG